MLDYNERMTMTKALDTAIASSKAWSEVAHKTFAEMAEKAREDVTLRGDFSFLRAFRMQFGIGEPTQTLNNRTLETQFILMLDPVHVHFGKFAREYDQANKRMRYMELLKTDKPKFVEMMQSEQRIHSEKMTLNRWGAGHPEYGLMQEVWTEFHAAEKVRQQQVEVDKRKQQQEVLRRHQEQQRIVAEAKRRLEQEAFEAAVQTKMRELKQ